MSGEDLEKGRARGKAANAVERCVEGQCCRGQCRPGAGEDAKRQGWWAEKAAPLGGGTSKGAAEGAVGTEEVVLGRGEAAERWQPAQGPVRNNRRNCEEVGAGRERVGGEAGRGGG